MRLFLKDETGASALEFAMLAPVLVVALLSMLDLAQGAFAYLFVDRVLRNGAQAAIMGEDDSAIRTVMENTTPASASYRITEISRTCACADGATSLCTTACVGGVVTEIILRLSVEWDFEILTPEALSIMQSPITGSLDVRLR